jgi:V/A-type H+-transporting ATPase subunit I
MIVNLHKYLIVGSRSEMDHFFELAQRAGFMEFIGLSHKKALEMPDDAKTILAALKIVKQHPAASHENYSPIQDPVSLAYSILKINAEHERLLEEQRLLQAEISRIAPFGDFSRHELDLLEKEGRRIFQFFCMKSDLARDIALPSELIYLGTEYDLDYFVAINKERAQYPKMIEILINRPVGELRKQLHAVSLEIAKTEIEIHESARATSYLQHGFLQFLDDHHLKLAKHDALLPMSGSLFAIEAWVPKTKIKALQGLISTLDVHAEEIAIEEKDKIPTYQENVGASKVGEDLVQVYDTPAWTDKDPSLWVLIFFAIFFAMIISDAGYGLIYLTIGLILKWKMKKATGALKRFIKLVLILSTSCIIWGVLTASFFGIEVGPNNPFRKVSFLHYMATKKAEYHLKEKDDVYKEIVKEFPAVATATDGHDFLLKGSHEVNGSMKYDVLNEFYDNILLELSLFMGVIHLSLSFLRYMTRNWTGLGWITFMIGGYLFAPSEVGGTSFIHFMGFLSKKTAYAMGQPILLTGLGAVLIISLLQKKKWGALHELTNAIQVFADVLSYIRLYALALAGMMMASTFNDLASNAGVFAGFFIILIGHAVNIGLSIMAGVIHGLRLNFLEWYHYSFEGGGKLFNPLRLRKVIHK